MPFYFFTQIYLFIFWKAIFLSKHECMSKSQKSFTYWLTSPATHIFRHFNGLPVKGELTISAYAVFFSGLLQPVFSTPARKVIDFDGQANMVYDLKTDLDLAEDAARPLVVEAILEEKNTLIRQNVSTRILLLRTPYRLKVTAPDRFKPSLPYIVQVRI